MIVLCWWTAAPAAEPLPPHPRLLLDAAGVRELRDRIAAAPWAKASWSELRAGADRALTQPVKLPPRGGNWSHNYVCPTHGARLTQGKQLGAWEWEHLCPVGNHVLRGDRSKATLDFDGNAIMGAHARLARQAVEHGLVFQITGDAEHARRAREILLSYADRYLDYELHDNQGRSGKGGRVASQSLTEAGWLVSFTQGADLVWSTLSQEERDRVTAKVLRPALDEVILPRRMGIHNIQCHHNSAIGLVGFLLSDKALIEQAIRDPQQGYWAQVNHGILGDGLWKEGSGGYHFYTISGLWPLAEAARHCGEDLYTAKLASMFDGPLALAMPDFVLPNFNDSGLVPLRVQADLYELALARFANPSYARVVAESDRRGWLAMLVGVLQLPARSEIPSSASRNLTSSGYAILSQGTGVNATWLGLKYGPHGGGHGHPDKNQFTLYARGEIIAPDAGTHAYGSPLHAAWDKTTLAHNTLVVDGASQVPATGKCLAFGREGGVDFAMTDAGAAYPGVRHVRTMALVNSNLVVIVDQVRCDQTRLLDPAYHQAGTWLDLPPGSAWTAPTTAGYRQLRDTQTRSLPREGLTLRTQIRPGWQSAMVLAGGEGTEVITGTGLLKTTEDRVPMVIQRRQSAATAFVWALSLDGSLLTLKASTLRDLKGTPIPRAEALRVDVTAGKEHWALVANPEGTATRADTAGEPAWETSARVALR